MAAAATDELLRPLLEAAVQVARAEAAAVPSVTPPRALGPVLNFSRLPPPALATVRRVLDGDPTFRERVLASVTVEDVGADGWLFLTRPDGWEEELAESVRAAESSRLVREEARVERSAARRVTQAEEAAREARRLADALTAELAEVTRLLADERRGRRASETEAGRLRARVAALEEELASGRAALAEVGAVTAESERLRIALDEARAPPWPQSTSGRSSRRSRTRSPRRLRRPRSPRPLGHWPRLRPRSGSWPRPFRWPPPSWRRSSRRLPATRGPAGSRSRRPGGRMRDQADRQTGGGRHRCHRE